MTELDLFNRYGRSGVEPFENWETNDLVDLWDIIESELNSRDRPAIDPVEFEESTLG